VFYKNLRDSTP